MGKVVIASCVIVKVSWLCIRFDEAVNVVVAAVNEHDVKVW